MSEQPDLSIIIPAYKEGERLIGWLNELATFLKTRDYGHVEVIVMLQGDHDAVDEEISRLPTNVFADCHYVNMGKRAGKGGAVRAGMFEARGHHKLFMDADLATPLIHLDDVYRLMKEHAQVGIAIRHLAVIHDDAKRKFITTVGNMLIRIVLLPGIKDTQCGFKVFSEQAADQIFSRVTIMGWGFDLEVLALARKFHYKIDTFFADDWHDPKLEGGLVGDSAGAAAVEVLQELFKVRWNLIRRRYTKRSFSYEPTTN